MDYESLSTPETPDDFMSRREGALIGAIAAHLAALNDIDLRAAPHDRSVFCDWHAVVSNDEIGLSSVSIVRTGRDCQAIDREACPKGHTPLLSFTYCLNLLGPDWGSYEAHEAPYQAEWASLNRSEMLKLLVDFVVSSDPIRLVAENIEFLEGLASED